MPGSAWHETPGGRGKRQVVNMQGNNDSVNETIKKHHCITFPDNFQKANLRSHTCGNRNPHLGLCLLSNGAEERGGAGQERGIERGRFC